MTKFEFGKFSTDTLCVQAGYEAKNGEPRILPIVQSTTYQYDSAVEVAALFDLQKEGHMYSRISNPTVASLESKIATLEGGVGALATSSGQAAILLSILTICNAGEHIVALNNLYGGTFTLLGTTFKKFGIEVSFVGFDASDEEIEQAIRPNTKLIYTEIIGNPNVDVLDVERLAEIAHRNGLPLFVDNTFATPCLCRPIEWGADVIIHSSTKYLDGHATSVGGLIVDAGKFDWTNGKFPHLTDPDSAYHGLSYTQSFGNAAFITKARVVFLRDLGATMSPFNAFLTNLGIETLALRMERHSQNGLAVAEFLQKHPKVDFVNYPLLETSPTYENAKKYLRGGGGVIMFGVRGGAQQAKQFIDSLELATLVVHVCDVRTHILHPASSTHRQLSEEDLKKAQIKPNGLRLSCGIEDAQDIIRDLEQALARIL